MTVWILFVQTLGFIMCHQCVRQILPLFTSLLLSTCQSGVRKYLDYIINLYYNYSFYLKSYKTAILTHHSTSCIIIRLLMINCTLQFEDLRIRAVVKVAQAESKT